MNILVLRFYSLSTKHIDLFGKRVFVRGCKGVVPSLSPNCCYDFYYNFYLAFS